MSIQSTKENLIARINTVAQTSDSLEDLSYASAALSKLAETKDNIVNPEFYTIGKAGTYGFGVAALKSADIPTGWTALPGHDNPDSENYGNYLDPLGSHMVFIPKFWFKWDGNTPLVSSVPASGYVLHEAFRHASKGFFRDKCHVGNVGGKPIAKIGIAPLSTHSANNPIGNLTGAPANNYGGFVDAIKLRSNSHHCETLFESNALAILALAHSAASQNTAVCEYKDIMPYLPKGNNNNALKDTNDSSVQFTTAGNASYSACALTGSGFPFAKTTHNGQSCGVADVNGNLWRVNIGITKANDTDGIFQLLKTTIDPNTLTSANLQDANNYDNIDLSALIPAQSPSVAYFGNGANQVFSNNQTINGADSDLRVTCAGFPTSAGVSGGGTNSFGNDGIWKRWIVNLLPVVGGNCGYSSGAGVFARHLYHVPSSSSPTVGGSACVTL